MVKMITIGIFSGVLLIHRTCFMCQQNTTENISLDTFNHVNVIVLDHESGPHCIVVLDIFNHV